MVLDLNDIKKYVINLPNRVDRKEQCISELDYFGWDYEFTNGIKKEPPHKGIGESHLKLIRIAKNLNLPYICIIEDDVLFQSKYKTKEWLNKAFKSVPDDFDLLVSGIYSGGKIKPYNDYWHQIGQFCGLHFYIVAEKMYDYILSWEDNHHIDRWMNLKEDKKVYCSNKFFAIQRDGWSDNVKKETKYNLDLNKKDLL